MRIFFFVLSALFLISCQNTTNENKSEAASESEEQEVEVIGFDDPLSIDFLRTTRELCYGNVRRAYERLNNRYVEFEGEVMSIKRTYFYIRFFDEDNYPEGHLKVQANKDVLVAMDRDKQYRFRGVFIFNSLDDDYCTQKNSYRGHYYESDAIQINNATIVEELTDSE